MNYPAYQKSLFAILSLIFAVNITAWSEIELGNKGALAVDSELSGTYSSNIEQNNNEESDFITQFQPLLRYRFDQGDVNIEAYAGVNFLFYDENDQYDAEDIKSEVKVSYPGGDYDYRTRYDWVFSLGYKESTSPNASVQQITSTERWLIDFYGRYFVSDNVYLRSGLFYRMLESQTVGFDDIDQWGFPLEIFYTYSEALNFGFGYSYQNTDVTDQAGAPESDSEDHAIYLAAEGQIAPSVTANVRVGFQQRKFDDSANFNDSDATFLDASIIWEISEQNRLELKGGSKFDTTINNESEQTVFAETELRHIFNDKIEAALAIGYAESEYEQSVDNRDDELIYANFDLVYSLIEDRLTLNARSSYDDRSSTRRQSNYDAFTFQLALNYLY